jgi:hypothetical protein
MFYDMAVYGTSFREGGVDMRERLILVAFFEMIRLEKITVTSDGGYAGA